jgi:hypothetical protein
MPRDPDDQNDMELDPSTGSETLDAGTQPQGEQTEGAESSAAQGDTDTGDTLSVVRDVVGEEKADPAAAASPAEGEETGQSAGEDASKKEQDNEEFSDVPFAKHPRFRELLRQRKEFQADAVRYHNVSRFIEDNGLKAEDAAEALTVAALAVRDPKAAWERLRPWVQNLLVAAGEVLPQDLGQRVQNGELSQEAAMELSRSRAQVQAAEFRGTFEQQQAERRQQQERATSIVSTAESWEADRRTKDPNFEAKLPDLQREIAWLHSTEGRPDSAAGVTDQLKRAYEAVNQRFRPAIPPPRRQATRPVTGGQVSSSGAQPVYNSTLDIVRAHSSRQA